MKLSTKSRYALRSMIDIASTETIISISEISERQNISERYLELIFSKLKTANLVKSIRGSQGGYLLVKSADDISVYDIIMVMEENAGIIKKDEQRDPIQLLLHKEVWSVIDERLEVYLRGIKLSSLL